MNTKSSFMIYGSYGYTGNLIANLAVESGYHPILAGRDADRLNAQAARLGLEGRSFSLNNLPSVQSALFDVRAVLHCAGPFATTAQPMVEACLKTGVHYLDVTGEVEVFEALAARDHEARAAGITLLPGVGFDVFPSDCLAAYLKSKLPSATTLKLAIRGLSQTSRGTALTAVSNLNQPSLIRQNGNIIPIAPGSKTLQVDFGRGPVTTTAISWGDVSTAYYSTGIPNIEVYMIVPTAMRRIIRASRYLPTPLVQATLKRLIHLRPAGPNEEQRARGKGLLWGQVTDLHNRQAAASMRTPEPYSLTAETALAAIQKALTEELPIGFQTPSMAFGMDFILQFDGVSRTELPASE